MGNSAISGTPWPFPPTSIILVSTTIVFVSVTMMMVPDAQDRMYKYQHLAELYQGSSKLTGRHLGQATILTSEYSLEP